MTSVEHPSLPIRYTATGEVTAGRTAIVDPTFGPRELLLIGSRLGGGSCWTGTVHVYDITGDQRDAPVTLLESDVPRVAPGDSCPAAQVLVDGADRRLRLAWTAAEIAGPAPVRTDIVRYDTTTAFIDRVGVCPLAPPA